MSIERFTKNKRLCITGYAESTFSSIPFSNRGWDIYGLNTKYRMYPRFNKWFEVHTDAYWKDPKYEAYLDFLQSNGRRTMLLEDDCLLPNASIIPIDAIRQLTSADITSSAMWMLLTAIVSEKYGCILLAGIDMATKEEYRKQRDGIYLAIDIALSKDIKILVPRNSRLFFETDAVLEDYRNRYLIVKRVPEYEAGNAGYDYGLGFRASRACERPLIKRLK